ncbi:hypothetical protein GX51_07211 [Blastomyces parvus]|uniref:Uncharacterized protein n=1 Tax=Blastomyces parvus TaxID=2060905 RepID=A0A2B7WLW1_9EURO|nr:hypothetical protein GX51_07211 [Blastomyces parvus]
MQIEIFQESNARNLCMGKLAHCLDSKPGIRNTGTWAAAQDLEQYQYGVIAFRYIHISQLIELFQNFSGSLPMFNGHVCPWNLITVLQRKFFEGNLDNLSGQPKHSVNKKLTIFYGLLNYIYPKVLKNEDRNLVKRECMADHAYNAAGTLI